jgi:hypothetical protein
VQNLLRLLRVITGIEPAGKTAGESCLSPKNRNKTKTGDKKGILPFVLSAKCSLTYGVKCIGKGVSQAFNAKVI